MASVEVKVFPIEIPIVGNVGGHLYLEFFDDSGNRIAQFNGFATDPITGQTREAGSPGDLLKIYNSQDTGEFLTGTGAATKSTHPHQGIELFNGSLSQVNEALRLLEVYQNQLNSADLQYDLTATGDDFFNSNSAANGMLDVLQPLFGFSDQVIEDAGDLGDGIVGNPGFDDDVFPEIVPVWLNQLEPGGNDGDGDGQPDSPFGEGGGGAGGGGGDTGPPPSPPKRPNREGDQGSPLVLDIDGDGVELYELGLYGTYFDLRGNGQAVLTGWVMPDDGLLALDLNGDGVINDIAELFGDEFVDGFTELATYDDNEDGVIDAQDIVFSDLLVWRDTYADGVSQSIELRSVTDYSIVSISLDTDRLTKVEIAGNDVSHSATYSLVGGEERVIVDAWFKYDVLSTANVQEYDFDIRTSLLPTLKGFGDLKDLHIAVSLDNDQADPASLMSQLIAMESQGFAAVLADWDAYKGSVEALLLRWSGAESIDQASRGGFVDAQHLAFNEAFYGEPFSQYGQPNPLPEAGEYAEAVFAYHVDFHASQLLAQIAGTEIFTTPSYDLYARTTRGNLSLLQAGINTVETVATASADGIQVWIEYAQFLAYAKGLSNLTTSEIVALDAAVAATGVSGLSDWQDVVSNMTAALGAPIESSDDWGSFEIFYDNYNPGTSSNDTLIDDNAGGFTDNEFIGFGGNDIIQALDGHDKLIGGTGNDTLEGGTGDDYLLGEEGNDIYVYESGNDTFSEVDGDGADEIRVLASTGLTDANVADLYRFGDDLLILLDNGAFLTIDSYGLPNAEIEKIVFQSDNSEIDLAGIVRQKYYGTNNADRMDLAGQNFQILEAYGFNGNDLIEATGAAAEFYGGDGYDTLIGDFQNDTLEGGDDDDALLGADGNDMLDGGEGNDLLDGGAGNDTIDSGRGQDTIVYGRGYDDDYVTTTSLQTDRIKFTDDTHPQDLLLERGTSLDDLIIRISDTSETLTLEDNFRYIGSQWRFAPTEYEFADGTIWSDQFVRDKMISDSITTTDDLTRGYDDDNIFPSSSGNDEIFGYQGADHYFWASGSGNDQITEMLSANDLNQLTLENLNVSDVIVDRNVTADDLILINNATAETFTVIDQFRGSYYEIDQFNFANATWTARDIEIQYISNNTTPDDDVTFGFIGDDIFPSSNGNDEVLGYQGNDHYFWGFGSGNDQITEMLSGNDLNQLTLENLNLNDVTVDRNLSADDLILINNTTAETFTVIDQFRSNYYEIDQFNFVDATWTARDIEVQYIANNTTPGNDVTHGFIGNDIFPGSAGNDQQFGDRGDDVLVGGSGADVLEGGNDDDVLFADAFLAGDFTGDGVVSGSDFLTWQRNLESTGFNIDGDSNWDGIVDGEDLGVWGSDFGESILGTPAANDILDGQSGDDFLFAGDGLDTLTGGSGADEFIFERYPNGNDITTITDFDMSEGDSLNILELLFDSYDPETNLLIDYVQLTDDGVGTKLSVDPTGGGNHIEVAELADVTDLINSAIASESELQSLVANGVVIVDTA